MRQSIVGVGAVVATSRERDWTCRRADGETRDQRAPEQRGRKALRKSPASRRGRRDRAGFSHEVLRSRTTGKPASAGITFRPKCPRKGSRLGYGWFHYRVSYQPLSSPCTLTIGVSVYFRFCDGMTRASPSENSRLALFLWF